MVLLKFFSNFIELHKKQIFGIMDALHEKISSKNMKIELANGTHMPILFHILYKKFPFFYEIFSYTFKVNVCLIIKIINNACKIFLKMKRDIVLASRLQVLFSYF